MKRVDGYYWVLFKGTHVIAEYNNGAWTMFHFAGKFYDKDFDGIDERRLVFFMSYCALFVN